MYALVKLYNGVVEEVVIGCDAASLEAQGDTWVAEHPGNNEYTIVAPRVSPAQGDAPLAILADIAAWAQEAADDFDSRDLEQDLADFQAIARHARRGLTLLADRLEVLLPRPPEDVEALAREAVGAMGDVFYDPDPKVDGYGVEELHSHVVSCVAHVIRRALAQAALPRLEEGDGRFVDFYVKSGDYWLARISIHDRFYTHICGWEAVDGEFRPIEKTRRHPSNRAVEIAFYGPTGYGPNDFLTSKKVSVERAAAYLRHLGINPEPLMERAREKGWEV